MRLEFTACLAIVALNGALAGPVLARSATQTVIVSMLSVDQISVTSTVGLAMSLLGGPGSVAVAGSDSSGRLSFSQSSTTSKKIAVSISGPSGNDITLTLAATIPGGSQGLSSGPVMLDNAGTLASSAQELVSRISAGAINNAVLTYNSTATTVNTPAGDYVYTITFTSAAV